MATQKKAPLVLVLNTGAYKVDGTIRRFTYGETFRADDPLVKHYGYMFTPADSTDAEIRAARDAYRAEKERRSGLGPIARIVDPYLGVFEGRGFTTKPRATGSTSVTLTNTGDGIEVNRTR